jgi:hypothetical protein
MLIFGLYWALALSSWAYALRFGQKPARYAFVLWVLAMIGTSVATDVLSSQRSGLAWTGMNAPLLATDFLYLVGLYILALTYRRYWLIWSAGLQLACVLTHFGPLVDPNANVKLYRAFETVWMLPMLVTMVLGISKDRKSAVSRAPNGHFA